MKVRPLEAQFNKVTITRIRALQARVSAIQTQCVAPRYLTVEIGRCLEAGLLLAALQVSCSVWEFTVRIALVKARAAHAGSASGADQARDSSNLLTAAEDHRQLTFSPMVSELASNGVLSNAEAKVMQDLYRDVRIPLHHGIVGRYVRERSDTTFGDLVGVSPAVDSRGFEEQLEGHAVTEIEKIFDQIELLCRRRAV
jgi:hypothetical protein